MSAHTPIDMHANVRIRGMRLRDTSYVFMIHTTSLFLPSPFNLQLRPHRPLVFPSEHR